MCDGIIIVLDLATSMGRADRELARRTEACYWSTHTLFAFGNRYK